MSNSPWVALPTNHCAVQVCTQCIQCMYSCLDGEGEGKEGRGVHYWEVVAEVDGNTKEHLCKLAMNAWSLYYSSQLHVWSLSLGKSVIGNDGSLHRILHIHFCQLALVHPCPLG